MKVLKPDYISRIRNIAAAQRNALVMSIAPNGEVLSYYGDDLWDFSPYVTISSNAKYINFSSLLFEDGSSLTDSKHSTLLSIAKDYLYVRLTVTDGGKTLGYKSLVSYWESRIRPFLSWMVSNGYTQLSNLKSQACLEYVKHCERAFPKRMGGKKKSLAKNTLFVRYVLLDSFWAFRQYMLESLPEHPWPGHSAISLSRKSHVSGDHETKTEQIPDRLMAKLVQGALRYVTGGYGSLLLDCRDAHENGRPIENYLDKLSIQNYRDHKDVQTEIRRLRTACFIIIFAFSGMRISEVLSLKTDCYFEHEGWDGATYGWLRGTTYKLEEDPKPAEWMVPPVVKDAVGLLIRIAAPIRKKLEDKISALEAKITIPHLSKSLLKKDKVKVQHLKDLGSSLFLLQYGRFSIMSEQAMREGLRLFCQDVDLVVEPSDLDQVRDRAKIKAGELWPIAPHQFRKTFARYVARCILGDVRYLREHFKHWSLDMTLSYAWDEEDLVDPTLIDEILDEHQELQSDIVQGWVDFNRNQHLAGVGGEGVKSERGRSRVLVATDLRAVARQLSKGYFLRGLGHSWCTEKECRGKGIYSVTECKECENRIIDESHIPVWKGIRQQQIDLLHCDDCGDPMWEDAVESLRYAEKVLRDLGETVKSYKVPPRPSERRRCA